MSELNREELISAYLDGELSGEERAQVEGWLAESAELRHLHDDLLALRATMQSLPRHKLDHDLAGGVVRRAEQSLERDNEQRLAAGTVGPLSTIASWWEQGADWRRVLWPTVAVAAALAILIYDASQRDGEQQVAQAPPAEPAPQDLYSADGLDVQRRDAAQALGGAES